jgi:hypothetical protein
MSDKLIRNIWCKPWEIKDGGGSGCPYCKLENGKRMCYHSPQHGSKESTPRKIIQPEGYIYGVPPNNCPLDYEQHSWVED